MAKKGLHPEWYNTKVFCDGKMVLEVGTTMKELSVDIWSGNHPFYTGSQKIIDTEGRVEKFERKYNFKEIANKKNENIQEIKNI
jgi:large subunit ribosomal protein L31